MSQLVVALAVLYLAGLVCCMALVGATRARIHTSLRARQRTVVEPVRSDPW